MSFDVIRPPLSPLDLRRKLLSLISIFFDSIPRFLSNIELRPAFMTPEQSLFLKRSTKDTSGFSPDSHTAFNDYYGPTRSPPTARGALVPLCVLDLHPFVLPLNVLQDICQSSPSDVTYRGVRETLLSIQGDPYGECPRQDTTCGLRPNNSTLGPSIPLNPLPVPGVVSNPILASDFN